MNALRAAANQEKVEESTFTEGQVIEARHGGGSRYYPGRIKSVNGDGTYDIDYDDGDKETRVKAEFIKKGSITASMVDAAKDVEAEAEAVAAERAKEIDTNLAAAAADTQADSNIESVVQSARETSNDGSSLGKLNNAAVALDSALFDVGQRVEARHGGKAKFYPGKIARVNDDGTFGIDYDDGDQESRVAADLIRSMATKSFNEPAAEIQKPADPSFQEDDRVEARYGGKAKWYLGRIERVYPDGTYDLVYDDGDTESRVQASLIRAISEKAREKERAQEDAEFDERARGARESDYVDEYDQNGRRRRRRRSPDRRKKSSAFKPKPRKPFMNYPDRSDVDIPTALQERTTFLANRSVLKMAQRDTPARELRRLVKEEGGDLYETDAHDWTALMWATSEGNPDMVETLLGLWRDAGEASDDEEGEAAKDWLDSKDKINGWTALHLAAIGGTRDHYSCARLLVKSRAKLDVKDSCLDEPVDCISVSGREALHAWRRLLGKGDVEMDTPRSPVSSVGESPRDRRGDSARGSARGSGSGSARPRRDSRDSGNYRGPDSARGSARSSRERETPRSSRRY